MFSTITFYRLSRLFGIPDEPYSRVGSHYGEIRVWAPQIRERRVYKLGVIWREGRRQRRLQILLEDEVSWRNLRAEVDMHNDRSSGSDESGRVGTE